MFESMYPALVDYLDRARDLVKRIPLERKSLLDNLAAYISSKEDGIVQLVFICTHNSRRSHMGQLWAQAASMYFGLQNVRTYSGGTEATAFHPNAVDSLKKAGINISGSNATNPRYIVRLGEKTEQMNVWSKKYDDPSNPTEHFCAVMTCSDADEACPFIPGSEKRVPLRYEDPKSADGTPGEKRVYDERSLQIATEMMYVMKKASEAR